MSTRKRTLRSSRSPQLEPLEPRQLMSAAVESVTGASNNLAHPTWGSASTDLIRLVASAYSDGISSPALSTDVSARTVSNLLNSQAVSSTNPADIATIDGKSLSDFGYSFGQFMDHDLDLTPDGGAEFDIPVSPTDPIGPNNLPFTRSQTDPSTSTSASNPAQQITTVTSYFDLSQVYGSSQTVSNALRSFTNGKLKTSPGGMLPYDNTGYFTPAQIAALNMANDAQAAPESALFAAGDVRANENIELTALQTLFVRNHNAIASQLHQSHPAWTDEQLYQEARKLNIAEYQNIVYNGWIPAVMGNSALSKYTGYKPNTNATISNEFSTVAFRFGHSLLSADIERHTNTGADIADSSPDPDISLAQDFFDPYLLNPTGSIDPLTGHTSSDIGPILKGEADGVSQANDLLAVNDVRNLLFGNGGLGGDDLVARDIQRGRDNGIPDYNSLRKSLGLKPVTSFSQISSSPQIQQELAQAYPGGVNTIDAFEGGLAETHVKNSDLGPLFQAILADQFTRLRDGDRFFYLNQSFTPEEKSILNQGSSLTQVIKSNTNITNLQSNAFLFSASITGSLLPAKPAAPAVKPKLPGQPTPPPPPPAPPINFSSLTIELLNSDNLVVATTTPDRQGHYSFDEQSTPSSTPTTPSGLSSIGTYKILVLSPTHQQIAKSTPLTLTHGDTTLQNINLTLQPPPVTNPSLAKLAAKKITAPHLLKNLLPHKA